MAKCASQKVCGDTEPKAATRAAVTKRTPSKDMLVLPASWNSQLFVFTGSRIVALFQLTAEKALTIC